jgi:hypothetical protein
VAKDLDDLQAVRELVQLLEPFSKEDRERIIRWSREKLGMAQAGETKSEDQATTGETAAISPTDIKSFLLEKRPASENQMAAAVAFYYHFVAPEGERRDYITKEDLIDAARQADWQRPKRPAQVLVNSYSAGLFDRGEKGQYKLNSVGENLVAMVLPEDEGKGVKPSKRRSRKTPKKRSKKTSKKRKKKAKRRVRQS